MCGCTRQPSVRLRTDLQVFPRAHEGRRIRNNDIEALVGGPEALQLLDDIAPDELCAEPVCGCGLLGQRKRGRRTVETNRLPCARLRCCNRKATRVAIS